MEENFRATADAALELPGIGPYTVAAILSIAYDAKLAVLDGNVARVIARLEAVRGDLREGGRWQTLQASADELLDRKSPGDWNQAMMELGATICTPRCAAMSACVRWRNSARRGSSGLQDVIPEKRKKRATEEITLAAAVFLDARGQTLLLPPPNAIAKTRDACGRRAAGVEDVAFSDDCRAEGLR